jgi:hypothetical protein
MCNTGASPLPSPPQLPPPLTSFKNSSSHLLHPMDGDEDDSHHGGRALALSKVRTRRCAHSLPRIDRASYASAPARPVNFILAGMHT